MSDIEEDIKMMYHIIEFYKRLDTMHGNDKCKEIKAVENILSEREADKKRIKELEEENTEIKNTKMNEYLHKNLWLAKHLNELYIPKQKVKEGLERIEDYFYRLNGPDEDMEYIRNIKKELLEDK